MAYPKISLEKVQMIIELTKKGESRQSIARKVPCSTSTVYYYQKEYNLI